LEELDRILELEDLAGLRYADAGLPPDLEGLSPSVVYEAHVSELLWVLLHSGQLVGFALCWSLSESLHLREIDVHPEWMGRGLGRRLVEHVVAEAARRGLRWLTLTTFRDVQWNAPLYAHLGFAIVDVADQPEWLRSIREEEDAGELARWPRVAMRRLIQP
jgi:GNAT superfamily N-acetyltransferase